MYHPCRRLMDFSFILHDKTRYYPCGLPTMLSSMLPSDQGIIHAVACRLFPSSCPTKHGIIHTVSRRSSYPCCHPTKLGIIDANTCRLFHSSYPTKLGLIYALPTTLTSMLLSKKRHYLCHHLPALPFVPPDEAWYHPCRPLTKLMSMFFPDKARI